MKYIKIYFVYYINEIKININFVKNIKYERLIYITLIIL